VIDLFPDFMTV